MRKGSPGMAMRRSSAMADWILAWRLPRLEPSAMATRFMGIVGETRILLCEVFEVGDVVVVLDAFGGGGDFGGGDDDGAVCAVEFDGVEFGWIFLVEEFVGLFEAGDFGAVNFFYGEAGEVVDLRGDLVGEDLGEDDDVFEFLEEAFGDVVGVEAADSDVGEFGCGEEVGIEGLEDEAGEDDVAGFGFVFDGVHAGGREGFEGDFDVVPRAFAEEADGDGIACEFAFDDFV